MANCTAVIGTIVFTVEASSGVHNSLLWHLRDEIQKDLIAKLNSSLAIEGNDGLHFEFDEFKQGCFKVKVKVKVAVFAIGAIASTITITDAFIKYTNNDMFSNKVTVCENHSPTGYKITASCCQKKTKSVCYIVEKGDNLIDIAKKLNLKDLTLNQVMIALVQENDHAFPTGNINLVLAGCALTIDKDKDYPSRKVADKEVAKHNREWNAKQL